MKAVAKALLNIIVILLWVPALILCHGTLLILAIGIATVWMPIAYFVFETLNPYLRACGWWEGWVIIVSFVSAVDIAIIGTVIYTLVIAIPVNVLSPIDKKLLEPFEKPF